MNVSKGIPVPSKKLNVGLIGLGLISNWHIQAMTGRDDVRIAALSDVNQAQLAQRGKALNIRALYPDYRVMLDHENLDIVDIMTPHSLHAQCVSDALRARRTVICEKPLATTLSDIDMMIRASKVAKKHIHVKQYLRYSLAYQELQNLLARGSIGVPYFTQCTFTTNSMHDYKNPYIWKGNKKEGGGGVFIDIGAHMLDLLQVMFGSPLATFAQYRKIQTTLDIKGEDFFSALIEFPRKLLVNITCTENDKGYYFRWEMRVYGTEGVITVIDEGKDKKTLQLIRENKVEHEFVENNWWEDSNIRAIADALDRIKNGREPAVPLAHARSVLHTILQSYESARIGKRVVL